jgi:putative membrane-bound dehydrogenase-like protein
MLRNLLVVFGLHLCSPVFGQGFTPGEAVKRMKLPPGFAVRCVASEPMIRQPLSISFDSRGRMWVLQYLQYPNPAGLKPVKQDQYLRTQWDEIPDPPPKAVKGLDKITICSDPDENGVFRKSKDFVSGLNLASGFCIGHGGVYVVQSPYLLYYPDKNEDDIPDGDPEVLLSGFGLDDTHSLANSLQWGPDGWLYGAAGSTSTCRIKDPSGKAKEPIEFQQGLWRYHPKTKQFELFSEGGGNTYGLDFDRHGNAIAGTNWGGFAMLHQMQGAYYVKGFSKHGPLHNPHAYGYFDHVPYKNFKGGHVTCGGILYEADAYPKEYRGQYIAGNLLSNAVYWHKMTPKGASFTAEHGGELLEANDTWFRPVDLQLGPDGCVYVADWYDKRAAHLDPIDSWDKTNGRVYRIEYVGERRDVSPPVIPQFDLRKKSNAELLELLKHPNMWWRREARRLLAERPADKETTATLTKWVKEEEGQLALDALWSLSACGGFYGKQLVKAVLEHQEEYVRAWAIRLLGDHPDRYEAAVRENDLLRAVFPVRKNPIVLAQLLASSKRHLGPGFRDALWVYCNTDVPDDPVIPLMLWWAIEAHADEPALYGGYFDFRSELLGMALVGGEKGLRPHQAFVLERFIRRLAEKNEARGDMLSLFIQFSDDARVRKVVLTGIDLGMRQGATDQYAKKTLEALTSLRKTAGDDPLISRLLVRLGDEAERKACVGRLKDAVRPEAERIAAVQLLTLVKADEIKPLLPELLTTAKTDAFRTAVIAGMEGFDEPSSASKLLTGYSGWSAAVQKRAVQALLSRPAWAKTLFQAHAAGTFPKADLTVDHARAAVGLNDPELTKLVEKQFGKVAASTAGEKRARIDALNLMLNREKPGDPVKGKAVFAKSCAACHQLFGEGAKVGPDLTSADRKNRYTLLTNIVDPSGYIRPEFVTHKVNTQDGRTLTGVVTEQTAEAITLANYVNSKVETTAVRRVDIDTLEALAVSLMPEKLLDGLSEEEIRDLIAYVMQDQKNPLTPNPSPLAGEGGKAKKLKIALVSGSLEYKSDDTLPGFQKLLEEKYPVECVRMFRKTDTDVPGLDKLVECDVAIFFTRRLKIDGDQLKAVKAYCESGKPVIGIRTASHGFQNWLEMDQEVLGGNYKSHYGAGPKCETKPIDAGKDHPVLKGVKPFVSEGSLYKNPDLPKDVTVLLTGTAADKTEPIAWVRERKVGDKTQRVFYTSLGHPKDFEEEAFTRMLRNAIGWCAKDDRFAK